MKRCVKCKRLKDADDFYRVSRSKDGRDGYCKACRKKIAAGWATDNRAHLNAKMAAWRKTHPVNLKVNARRAGIKKAYGLTLEEHAMLFAQQGGKCAVCAKDLRTPKDICLDHDHKTGKIRGFLCNPHNTLLGMAQDNVEILKRAIAYLEMGGVITGHFVPKKE